MLFTFDSKSFREGWDHIFRGKPLGTLLPLPSESEGFIVNFSEEFCIYSILPPKDRDLELSISKFSDVIKPFKYRTSLALLLLRYIPENYNRNHISPCLCHLCLKYKTSLRGEVRYTLLKEDSNSKFIPYMLPNVYAEGSLCLKNEAYTPKQTNMVFWSSVFNNDFGRYSQYCPGHDSASYRCICERDIPIFAEEIRKYDMDSFRDFSVEFFPFKGNYVASRNLKPGVDYAIFISQHPKIVDSLPKDLHRYSTSFNLTWGPYAFGLAFKCNEKWVVDFSKGYKRELLHTEITIPSERRDK